MLGHRLSTTQCLALLTTLLACGANQAAPQSTPAQSKKDPAAPSSKTSKPLGAGNVDRVRLRWRVAAGGFTRGVAIHRGAGTVFMAADSDVQAFAVADGSRRDPIATCHEHVRGGLLRFADSLVVVCERSVERYDLDTNKRLPLDADPTAVTAAALADGKLALARRDGVIHIHDLLGGPDVNVAVPGPPIDVKSLALSPDGRTLVVAWVQGSIWWWDVSRPSQPHKLIRYAHESDCLAFSHDGRLLAEEGKRSFTTLWAFDGRFERKMELRNGAWLKRLIFLRDGKWLVRAGSDGLELAEAFGPKRRVLDAKGQVEDAALDETGSLIAAGDRKGRLTLWAHE